MRHARTAGFSTPPSFTEVLPYRHVPVTFSSYYVYCTEQQREDRGRGERGRRFGAAVVPSATTLKKQDVWGVTPSARVYAHDIPRQQGRSSRAGHPCRSPRARKI